MIAKIGKIVWRNDKTAARSINLGDITLAAIGTMAILVVLGAVIIVLGLVVRELSLFRHGYLLPFGFLFLLSPILSWFGLMFGSTVFFIAARCGVAGWLPTILLGVALTALVYLPFIKNDIHPVVLVLFGGLNAMTFWIVVKARCSSKLIQPQSTRQSS